jgi:hypothetical protein
MDYVIGQRKNLEDIYFQLTPENKACLAASVQLCRIAENAVKKDFARGETQLVTAAVKQQQGFDLEFDQ